MPRRRRPAATALLVGAVASATLAALIGTGVPAPQAHAATATTADVRGGGDDMVQQSAVPSSRFTTPKATSTSSTGTTTAVDTVYVARVTVTTATSDDTVTNLDDASIKSAVTSLHDYWSTQSAGAVDVEFGAIENDTATATSCDPQTVFDTVSAKAFGGIFANGAWYGTHKHLIILTKEPCGGKAFATVGGNGGVVFSGNGAGQVLGVSFLLHEFGHNLGFQHAGGALCRSTTDLDGQESDFVYASDSNSDVLCPTLEYGDFSDIMGYSIKNARPALSSPQRIMAGWLTDYTSITQPGTSADYTVKPLGGTALGRALRVTDPSTGAVYYVEYRTDAGADSTNAEFGGYDIKCADISGGYQRCGLDSSATTGAVRILRTLGDATTSAPFPATAALAVGETASGTPTSRHTHLDAGDSFTDDGGLVTIRVVSLSPKSGAVIRVTIAGSDMPGDAPSSDPTAATSPSATPTAAPTDPTAAPTDQPQADPSSTTTTLSLSKSTQTYGSSSTAVETVQVSLDDGSDVAAGTVTFTRGTAAIASVKLDASGRASHRLSVATPVGAQKLTATFTPAADGQLASTSTSRTLTVAKATPVVKSHIVTSTVKRTTSPKLIVAVSATGISAPTGTITVYYGGTAVKRYTLTSASKGRVTLTLPKRTKTGSVGVVATYGGSSTIGSGRATSQTLRVVG